MESYLEYLDRQMNRALDRLGEGENEREPIGILCHYVPEEVLHAAGFQPVRLFGRVPQVELADRHLQSYVCSHVRGVLEDFLAGRYGALKGVVFGHTCDTMQGFFDVFRRNHPDRYVHQVNFPSRLTGEAAFRYALEEFHLFQASVERLAGRPIDEEVFEQSVSLHDRVRRLLEDLYGVHAAAPDLVTGATVLKSVVVAMTSDKETFAHALAGYLDSVGERPGKDRGSRLRLMIVGSVLPDPGIHELIDDLGATVVTDDLCTGFRYVLRRSAGSGLEGLARQYFEQAFCPAKHRGVEARAEVLTERARRFGVDGVLFVHLKFCDPHAFDYPYLRDALEGAGMATQVVELAHVGGVGGQVETKIEAFVELLARRRRGGGRVRG